MRIVAAEEISIFRSQVKNVWRMIFLQCRRKLIVRQLIWRRLVEWLIFAARRMMQCSAKNIRAPIQFVINATKNLAAFELKRGETKTREHEHEDQAIPDLQPPFDGFENFHSMQ